MSTIKLIFKRDPLYGIVSISNIALKAIKSPEFQRLKRIRQLGALDLVFPFTSHHYRYEHCIGVAHLSRFQATELQKHHPSITDKGILHVELAGLFHDIGHGPFSHVFDHVMEEIDNKELITDHEDRSKIIARHVLSKIKEVSEDDIKKVIEYIHPTDESKDDPLSQIVCNTIHGVDVDRIDYLERDAQYMRIDQILVDQRENIKKMLSRTRIVNNVLMYHIRDYGLIYDLVCRRLLFHTNRYSHPDVTAASYMIEEIFRQLYKKNPDYFNCLSLKTEKDIRDFTNMTDDILEEILNTEEKGYDHIKDMIMKIIRKDLHKHIGDYYTRINTDENSYAQIPWKVYTDKSTPTNIIPKIRFHMNGVEEILSKDPVIYRLYNKE